MNGTTIRRVTVRAVAFAAAMVALAPMVGAQGSTVVCESSAGARSFCSADTSRGVTLARELGSVSCAGNWGSDDSGIWVADGCRAEFLLGPAAQPTSSGTSLVDVLTGVLGGGGATTSSSGGSLVCESRDNRRVECPADTRSGVELVRQLSRASCEGAWGVTGTGIWVDQGCRAEFRLKTVPVTQTPEPTPTVAPTPTPAPARSLVCQSRDSRHAFCSADTAGGVDLVRQIGGVPCTGHWGYDSDGVWVDGGCQAEFTVFPAVVAQSADAGTLTCSSKRGRRAFCSADIRSGVTLERQLGDAPCVGNWGYDADGIWVDHGCSAVFRTSGSPPTATPLPGPGSVVVCESGKGLRAHCAANTGSGVKLQRQLSTAPCVGHWGYDATGIWVDGDCRAEFLIR